MDWKELFKGFFVSLMGVLLLFFGIGFYLIGRELYGSNASLIWIGGMLVLISVHTLVDYFVNLWWNKK